MPGTDTVSILIGGDVCPRGLNEPLFRQGDAAAIFGDLLPEFERADCRVVNLECPLITHGSPAYKAFGFVLGVPRDCINGLKTAGIDAVNLANNHILDHGAAGLGSTIEACRDAGIAHFGAGADLAEAGRILIRDIKGRRVGFYGAADNWFTSTATARTAGANPIDIISLCSEFRKELPNLDHLIVLLHAGIEHYAYPNPGLHRLCRFLAEQGADAVICQHSHYAGSWEYHAGVPIVYGQGNLLFYAATPRNRQTWDEGFLVRLELGRAGERSFTCMPTSQSPEVPGIRRATTAQRKRLLDQLAHRAREIQEQGFIERRWARYCQRKRYAYEAILYNYSKLIPERLNRKLRLSNIRYPAALKWRLRNILQCRAHREIILTLLENDPAIPMSRKE